MGRVYAIKSSSVQWKNINKSTFSCKIFKAFFPLSSFVASQQMLGLYWTFVKSTSLESFSILISVGIRVSLQHTGPNIFYLLMQMILRNKVLQRQLILKLFNSVVVNANSKFSSATWQIWHSNYKNRKESPLLSVWNFDIWT